MDQIEQLDRLAVEVREAGKAGELSPVEVAVQLTKITTLKQQLCQHPAYAVRPHGLNLTCQICGKSVRER